MTLVTTYVIRPSDSEHVVPFPMQITGFHVLFTFLLFAVILLALFFPSVLLSFLSLLLSLSVCLCVCFVQFPVIKVLLILLMSLSIHFIFLHVPFMFPPLPPLPPFSQC